MHIQLKSLLNEILHEIGEGSSKPFEYEQIDQKKKGEFTSLTYHINATTSKGDNISLFLTIQILSVWNPNDVEVDERTEYYYEEHGIFELIPLVNKAQFNVADVNFTIRTINDREADLGDMYMEVNDPQYMYRFMATLKELLGKVIKDENIDVISYSPFAKVNMTNGDFISDQGKGRDRLYSLIIKKALPASKRVDYGDFVYYILK